MYHVPALLNECIEGLNIQPNGIYVDVTFGGGGHSEKILEQLGKGKLIAFDQDINAKENLPEDNRVLFLNQNFRFLKNNLRFAGINSIDGLIADLGVSFHQFDKPERGFSYRFDTRLDMRMNRESGRTAADILNSYEIKDLDRVLREYGELKRTWRISETIVAARSVKLFETTGDLLEAVKEYTPAKTTNKFYAQLFQALRIEVNREMEYLKEMLLQGLELLKPNGRMVVVTYHSLEDRVVKNFFRTGNFDGLVNKDFYGNVTTPFTQVNRKVITPSDEELAKNSRARSAKLRVAEKI
jgi:16S rRNA (cytosine1402-N4)-methyltransferase